MTTPLLRASGLTKRYPGAVALDNLSIEVPRGLVGLVGANGAGKTTLFRLMLGLTRPTSGTVEVCGRSVLSDPVGVRARLGYMPEHECLPLDQTAAEVVASLGEISGLSRRLSRQRASEMLDLVGLDEARFRAVGGFSTGMRQRVKLAQALVAGPELALLDEPTAGLDPTGREEMLALVARLATFGISVLLATHLLDDVAQVCDYVVVLEGGRLVVAGATDSFLERAGTVAVEVGSGAQALALALSDLGMAATAAGGLVEVVLRSDDDFDAIRDAVANLELPLHRLSSRAGSLDEAFLTPRSAARSGAG